MKRTPVDPTRPLVLRFSRSQRRTSIRQAMKLVDWTSPSGAKTAAPRTPLTALGDIMNDLRHQLEPK